MELCTTYSSSSPVVTTSIILCFNKQHVSASRSIECSIVGFETIHFTGREYAHCPADSWGHWSRRADAKGVTPLPLQESQWRQKKVKPSVFLLVGAGKRIRPVKLRTKTSLLGKIMRSAG